MCVNEISIHFLSLIKNHGFLRLSVRSVDMTKCSETSFEGKIKEADTYRINYYCQRFLVYQLVIWSIFAGWVYNMHTAPN